MHPNLLTPNEPNAGRAGKGSERSAEQSCNFRGIMELIVHRRHLASEPPERVHEWKSTREPVGNVKCAERTQLTNGR